MADSDDAAGVVPEPRMHTGSTSGPIIRPEGLGLPVPERVVMDEASDEVVVDLLGELQASIERARRPGKEEGWANWPTPPPELGEVGKPGWRPYARREPEPVVQQEARTYREILEAEGPGGPGGVGFRANAGNRAGKSSARVYGFGDFTFEYNSLTGDVTVTSRTDFLLVEPTKPGQARLTSKRRQGQPGVGIG